jgi:hypothetical protein
VDLALIDIIMPEMNGIEFAARIADMRAELLYCFALPILNVRSFGLFLTGVSLYHKAVYVGHSNKPHTRDPGQANRCAGTGLKNSGDTDLSHYRHVPP